MAHAFRLLATGEGTAAFNMALDEAILEAVSAGQAAPTLRLYAWKPAAISIGYFQGLAEEVDLDACAANGADVVRRITGGGAVFHQAEITYSIVIPEGHPLFVRSVLASYERICAGVIAGLGVLGIQAAFAPINDIVAGGKKVSGNAQTRKKGCILQHGTVLLDVDVELMFDLLKVPAEKAKGKLIEDVKQRVTGLRALRGSPVPYAEAEAAMAVGFAEALSLEYGTQAASGQAAPSAAAGAVLPTPAELAAAAVIAAEKFATEAWTAKR